MASESGFRKPGRPRVEGSATASERAQLARQRLRSSGGHEFQVLLGAEAWQALQRLAPKGERTLLLERLILEEMRRRTPASAG
jgi:hypothetical protein